MSAILEIKQDSEQAAAEQQQGEAVEAEVTLQDLPAYLKDEPEQQNSMVVSIIAVVVFLLAIAGPIAGMKLYLQPQLATQTEELESTKADLTKLDRDIETEKRRGQEHEMKLGKIEKQVLSPANDRNLDVVIAEVNALATRVAKGRAKEGGYVTVKSLVITEKGEVTLAGTIDGFFTLADWLEALEESDYLAGVRFTGAAAATDLTNPSIPYSLQMKVEVPKKSAVDSQQSAAPTTAPSSLPSSTPPSTVPPSSVSSTPSTSPQS